MLSDSWKSSVTLMVEQLNSQLKPQLN